MEMNRLSQIIHQLCDDTIWSDWHPLEGCWRGHSVPERGGIYRIRAAGKDDLLYIGETGNIRQRVSMLKPVYGDVMPYRSPHVAGPHLYALRTAASSLFEVSTAAFDLDEPHRKGMEYLAIALHRQRFGRSPAANFGRMLAGWRASSSNTTQLAARGLRYRGGPTAVSDESHIPGVAPLAPLDQQCSPQSLRWGGHQWSPWCSITAARPGQAQGLYRLRQTEQELFFLGQGRIAERLKGQRTMEGECSWVSGSWAYHQQLELVCDLVAAYLVACKALPPAQFV